MHRRLMVRAVAGLALVIAACTGGDNRADLPVSVRMCDDMR